MMTYNIPRHRRGDTWDGINSISITVNNVPVNLFEASIKMDFRSSIDAPVAMTFSTDDGTIIVLDPTTGSIRLPARLIEVPYGTYLYDLQVTFLSGVVKTYISGSWEIFADITE